jgi:RNA polymerase sigma factor (sigma-70 family)
MEENDLSDLLSRVRQGDQAAFETIFNRYRLIALSWANSVVRDPHLANDVVQEAFMRMKGKIHQLKDDRKFIAWFRLMVRRLSINFIRGASHNSELTIEDVPEQELLGYAEEETSDIHAWQEWKDSEEMVQHSLSKLSRQARQVLNASAYKDETTEELAIRFNMKKSNVYNILSRARIKANEERFQTEIDSFVQERRGKGHLAFCHLSPPSYSSPYAFISVMIGEALRSAGETNFSYTELMGISADAFRMNMPEGCNWRGILTFDWSLTAYRTMERLGFSGVCFGRPQQRVITPDLQVQMLSVILGSIDRGIPAVIRNMEINEMGFAYGYDDHSQEIWYRGYNGEERLYRYDQMGRTADEHPVFVLGLRGRVSPPRSENDVLRSIVDHAKGKEPPLTGYAFGLDGYRIWIEAVEENRLDLSGHAYQVAILTEARLQAAHYLRLLSERGGRVNDRRRLLAAAECYKKASESFHRLYPRFPFGYGGSSANRLHTIQEHLREAWAAEQEGISLIESFISQ